MPETCDAIIFDCDGVLVNSELIAQRIELELLSSIGMRYPRDEYVRRFSGTHEPAYRAALREDAELRFHVELTDGFLDQIDAAIDSAYDERLRAVRGAQALAAAWPKAKAVASSSSLASVLRKLRATGLAELFGRHIYSADAVNVGKPDPALFLYTADQLGVRPSRCLVVEDSMNGVVAAKRAGMTAIGFVGGGHCLDDHAERLASSGASMVFDALEDLTVYLGLSP